MLCIGQFLAYFLYTKLQNCGATWFWWQCIAIVKLTIRFCSVYDSSPGTLLIGNIFLSTSSTILLTTPCPIGMYTVAPCSIIKQYYSWLHMHCCESNLTGWYHVPTIHTMHCGVFHSLRSPAQFCQPVSHYSIHCNWFAELHDLPVNFQLLWW